MRIKKRYAAVALAAVAAIVLSACSTGGGGGDGEKVSLRFALWDPGWAVGYEASIAEFEKQNPDIDIQLEQTVWDQYWAQLQTQLVAGTGPDVFNDHSSYYTYFAAAGAIQPLTPLAEDAGYDWSILNPDLVKTWTGEDGQVYGAPTEADTIAIAFNSALTEAAGLSEDDLNGLSWNADDGGSFLAAMQALTIDANGVKANEPGFDPNSIVQYGMQAPMTFGQGSWWNFVASNDGKIQDQPFGNWTLTDPKTVEAIQFAWDLVYTYHVAYPISLLSDGDRPFATGQVATYWRGSWNVNVDLETFADLDWGIFKVPDGPAGAGESLDSTAISVSSATEHPEEAWRFAQWLVSPESQKLMGGGGYYWPSVLSEQQTFVDYWAEQGVNVQAFGPGEDKLVQFPVQNNFNEADILLNQLLEPMWLGQQTPADTLADADDQVNAIE